MSLLVSVFTETCELHNDAFNKNEHWWKTCPHCRGHRLVLLMLSALSVSTWRLRGLYPTLFLNCDNFDWKIYKSLLSANWCHQIWFLDCGCQALLLVGCERIRQSAVNACAKVLVTALMNVFMGNTAGKGTDEAVEGAGKEGHADSAGTLTDLGANLSDELDLHTDLR